MLQQKLLQILNNYISNKQSKYEENELAKLIRKKLPKTLEKNINNGKIKVKGSCGQGQWAEVPWIAFLHSEITDSTQHGCFVVYLFKANMDGLYISLNQGWQYFKDNYGTKKGIEQIKIMADHYQDAIVKKFGKDFFPKEEFDTSILLESNKKGYEAGHIYGKYYSIENLNSISDKELIDDLKKLINKYSNCVESNIFNTNIQSDIDTIKNDSSLTETQKKRLIDSRLDQGKFRKDLIELYPECPVTKVNLKVLLKASHIKPWRVSNNKERLDPFNGFMLAAHIDALFDKGYISFSNDGSLLISTLCKKDITEKLNINTNTKIKSNDESKEYLKWHRDKIFIK